jgi:hypothetical protein
MGKIRNVYHYCSIETFFAIITNKCLRLSDLNKTNDYMEKKWVLKLIDKFLIDCLNEYNIKLDLNDQYWYEENINSHMEFFMKTITEKLSENNPVLITCFSKEKDLLSQWRAYAEDGTGIAIGFNLDILEKLYTSKLPIAIDDVIYNQDEQKDSIECEIKISLEDMIGDIIRDNDISDELIDEYFEEEFDNFCEILQDRLPLSSCFIKNPAFKEEKEVRIVYHPKLYDGEHLDDSDNFECFTQSKRTKNFIIRPVKFNVRNKKIVAYADLDFSYYIKKGLISEIMIGPKSNIVESDIIYLLLSNGYLINEIIINKSQATYR